MPGMGLTSYPNQYEVNKSDKDKVNNKVKIDAQYLKTKENKEKSNQKPIWQNITTPTVSSASALSHIRDLYHSTDNSNKDAYDKSPAETMINQGKAEFTKKEESKDTSTNGNPNGGNLKVDMNAKSEDGMGRLDKESNQSSESSAPAKEEPTSAPTTTAPVSKPKAKSSGSRRNPDLENSGKTKEWYENLANSSYAKDKKYEADMQAYNKMKSDEIAKNGYYTDSQGVKVYAKAMSDTPKEKKNA